MDEYPIGATISGKLVSDDSHLYVWMKCDICEHERWINIQSLMKQKQPGRCLPCKLRNNEHSANWKGGRIPGGIHGSRYLMIWVTDTDFFYPMIRADQGGGGYVAEHRLVMAKHLGRCLQSWEIVHHKNGVRTDNRIENLQLMSDLGHKQLTLMMKRIQKLEIENQQLRQRCFL